MFLPPAGGPESGFLVSKCTGLICKNVIPTEGRKHFRKTRMKNLASGGKRVKKVQLENVMRMLGALVGVRKLLKGHTCGEKVTKMTHLGRRSCQHRCFCLRLGVQKVGF